MKSGLLGLKTTKNYIQFYVNIINRCFGTCADPLMKPPPTQVAPIVRTPTPKPMSRPASITCISFFITTITKFYLQLYLFTCSVLASFFLVFHPAQSPTCFFAVLMTE